MNHPHPRLRPGLFFLKKIASPLASSKSFFTFGLSGGHTPASFNLQPLSAMIFDTYIIPTFALAALINDDWQGLTDQDTAAIRAFQQSLPKGGHLSVRDGDPYYSTRHELRREMDGVGGMCLEVDYVMPKPKPEPLYNGWANYQTWNIALWLQNDEGLYRLARNATSYESLVTYLRYVCQMPDTPDGVAWDDPALDTERLEALIAELRDDA